MKLETHPSGMKFRPGTSDEYTWSLVRNDYKQLRIEPGDVVMDLGANIGIFTDHAARLGAGMIVAYEPEQENCAIWLENKAIKAWPAVLIEAAVGGGVGVQDLYVSTGKGRDGHSLHTKGQKKPVEVPVVSMKQELAMWTPNVVKCDIEYSEYDFMDVWENWPDYVLRVSVELHLQRNMRQDAAHIAASMEAQGFTTLRSGIFTTGAWHTICTWERG